MAHGAIFQVLSQNIIYRDTHTQHYEDFLIKKLIKFFKNFNFFFEVFNGFALFPDVLLTNKV